MLNKCLALGGLLALSLNVNANMIEHDWQGFGDNHLTYVSELNIEILDVSFTSNTTHQQLAGKLSDGGEYSGFRFLRSAELGAIIETYFGSMGSSQSIYLDSSSAGSANISSFLNLIDAPSNPYGRSVVFNTCEHATGCEVSLFSSPSEPALLDGERWYFAPEVVALIDQVGNSTQLLVRDVVSVILPEPSALYLFGLGLFAMVGMRRRKVS